MRYLKTFEEVTGDYSVFDTDGWERLLPKELTVVTDTGSWTLEKPDWESGMGHAPNVTGLMNCLQISYYHNTVDEQGDVTADGEPSYLAFDIDRVKDNDGSHANPDSLKLDVDITYGDAMKSEFTITAPNQISIGHYNGYGSQYDPETFFGFDDSSLDSLVGFFNSFGFSLDVEDFDFLSKYQKNIN